MSTMATEVENPFAGQGSVLLDIGDDVGAVVVEMPVEMEGVEVEIRPDDGGVHEHEHGHDHDHDHDHGEGSHSHHPHVAVVNRPVEGGQLPSLVFPEVREGRYGLYLKETDVRRLTLAVAGGQVTSAEWPR
jgi:ABC-type Zn2+ transport system substrate-binding protein/surface adhesin